MTSSRYYNAFLLSTLVFLVLYYIFLIFSDTKKIQKATPSSVIKVALITPPKKVPAPTVVAKPIVPAVIPPPVIVKKIPKKVVKKKIVKKKIVKKKVIKKPKPKKVVQKKRIVQKVKPKKIIKKRVIKKPIETYVPIAPPIQVEAKPIMKSVVKPTTKQINPTAKSDYHKKVFLRNVRSKIIANKKYPRIAKRRHIEGSVKVRFDITERGHVSNIRFINGKRIFHKSVRKTLVNTFPMGIPNEIKHDLPISDVTVILHFNIK